MNRAALIAATLVLSIGVIAEPAAAQKKYDPGASDTEIKIGNTMPYSGPVSSYSPIGKLDAAFFGQVMLEVAEPAGAAPDGAG